MLIKISVILLVYEEKIKKSSAISKKKSARTGKQEGIVFLNASKAFTPQHR